MSEPDWDSYPDFARHEFVCSCGCGRADMDEGFMRKIQAMRDAFDEPLVISSGFRCPEHNARVSNTGRDGPHTKGRAADIAVSGDDAYDLLPLIFDCQFTGVGLKQTGAPGRRFIHVDDLMPPEHSPRPWVWTY